jgi:hypothetical protein
MSTLDRNGPVALPPSTVLCPVGGSSTLANNPWASVGSVAPGEEFEVSIALQAPSLAGRYVQSWLLKNAPEGEMDLGLKLWTESALPILMPF